MIIDNNTINFVWLPDISQNWVFDKTAIRRLLLMADNIFFLEDPRYLPSTNESIAAECCEELNRCVSEGIFNTISRHTIYEVTKDLSLFDNISDALVDAENYCKVIAALSMRPGLFKKDVIVGEDFYDPPFGFSNYNTKDESGYINLSWFPSSNWLPQAVLDYGLRLWAELGTIIFNMNVDTINSNISQLDVGKKSDELLLGAIDDIMGSRLNLLREASRNHIPSALLAIVASCLIASRLEAQILPTAATCDAIAIFNSSLHKDIPVSHHFGTGLDKAYQLLFNRLNVTSAIDKTSLDDILKIREKLVKPRRQFLSLAKELRADLNHRLAHKENELTVVEDFYSTKIEHILNEYTNATNGFLGPFGNRFRKNLHSNETTIVASLLGLTSLMTNPSSALLMTMFGGLAACASKTMLERVEEVNSWPELVRIFISKSKK